MRTSAEAPPFEGCIALIIGYPQHAPQQTGITVGVSEGFEGRGGLMAKFALRGRADYALCITVYFLIKT